MGHEYDEERAGGDGRPDGGDPGTIITAPLELATDTPAVLPTTRQALLTILNDPNAMAPVKLAAAGLAGGRGPDVAEELLADAVGDTWAGDTVWDPAGATPGAMQGHLIAAMKLRAKEMYRREKRARSLAALPQDNDPATRDATDEREVALAARLDRLPRLLPRLREQLLRDDPEALRTLSLFEAEMGRAQVKSPEPKSRRERNRCYHNARRRVRRAARAIEAELVEAELLDVANGDIAASPDAVQPPETVITSLAATLKPHLRTRSGKLEPATSATGPTVRKRGKRSE